MDSKKVYSGIIDLLPYIFDKSLDFQKRLKNALKKYEDVLESAGVEEQVRYDVAEISKKLNDIVFCSLDGKQATAFIKLKNLIRGSSAKINLISTLYTKKQGTSFYRMRVMDSSNGVSANELFHIPFNKRGIIKTQRYSNPGYPCLYLGESIYGCWEEMRRPPLHSCLVSMLENTQSLNFLNLTIPTEEQVEKEEYIRLIPLIISCMIPVAKAEDTFKPEYIIPQLIIEYVLNFRSLSDGTKIHGIAYTSSHLNKEFSFPKDKSINYAVPAFKVRYPHLYCPELCKLFKITHPTTNEIEKLKLGYSLVLGAADYDTITDPVSLYVNSDFGQLEKRIQSTKFKLKQINSK